MKYALILFDIDLTLVATGGAGRKAMNSVFRNATGNDNPMRGISFDGRTDCAIFREALRIHSLPDDEYERLVEAYLVELEPTMGETPGMVLPGVVALLDGLARLPAAVGLATGNFRRGGEIKLRHYDLWERFAGGGFGDDSPRRADVVAEAIRAVSAVAGGGLSSAQTLVIGDTPLDVEAAHAAGAAALAVATGNHTAEALRIAGADYVMTDLSATADVLRVLGA